MDASFPSEVPKLKAEQMHRGDMDGPNGTHCLAGWRAKSFGWFNDRTEAWVVAFGKLVGWPVSTAGWNDSHTLEECADAWNRTALALGYIDAGDKFVKPTA